MFLTVFQTAAGLAVTNGYYVTVFCNCVTQPNFVCTIIKFYFMSLFQPFNVLIHPIKTAKQQGMKFDSKILDINNVDVSEFC